MDRIGCKRINLVLSLSACFAAVRTGALAVCAGIMVLDSGPLASLERIAVWVIAQPIILPIALLSAPLGTLLRMILGLVFEQPRSVALISGSVIGLIGSGLFAFSTNNDWSAWFSILSIGSVAGLVRGWTWRRVEKPFLDRPKSSDTH